MATFDLLKSGNAQRHGISSFTENTLDSGQHLVVDGVRVSWGASASNTSPAAVTFGNTLKSLDDVGGSAKDIPAAILNGDLIIKKNGVAVISIPVRNFIAPADVATSALTRPGTVMLKQVKTFEEKSRIDIELRCADGQVIPGTEGYYLNVQLVGLETVPTAGK